MQTHSFPLRFRPSFAALGFALVALTGFAQVPAIPDAPTVPVAPTLPDSAIVREPLTPAASQELIEERPSAQHIWVAAHWRWQEGRYAWIAGRWELPPRANVVWVEPRWEKRANGYVLVGGYWQETAPAAAPVATAPVVAAPSTPAPVYASAPPAAPVVMNSAPPTVIVVEQAPPPPPREYIIERPSPRYVWIDGYWGWRAGRHVWVGGHWELPPRERVEWVQPRWEHRSNGYVLVEGFWRDIGGSGISVGVSVGNPTPMVVGPPRGAVVLRNGPPPLLREFVDERYRPSRDAVWLAGYWRHDGRAYVWIPGRWDVPPRGYRQWDGPRWEHRDNGYIFIEGRWH